MSTTLPFPMPLAEKYRPHAIADFVGLDKPKRILAKFAANPYTSAWLFNDPPGTGKTTMALALAGTIHAEVHHIPSQQCLVANVEDVIRQCWYVPASGGFHLVLVDEADKMSNAAAKAADIIALYLHPPQHAAVFCVDEKTAIQGSGSARHHAAVVARQGGTARLRVLPPWNAIVICGFGCENRQVKGKTAKRHTSAEFIAFLSQFAYPDPVGQGNPHRAGQSIGPQNPAVEEFLARHPTNYISTSCPPTRLG